MYVYIYIYIYISPFYILALYFKFLLNQSFLYFSHHNNQIECNLNNTCNFVTL